LQLAKLDEKQNKHAELKEEHHSGRNGHKQLERKNAKLKRGLQQAKRDRYRKGKQTKELEKKDMATIHDLQKTIGQLNRVVSDQKAEIKALHAAKLAKNAQGQSGPDAEVNADLCSSHTEVDKVALDANTRADPAQDESNDPWAQTWPQQGPEQYSSIWHVDLFQKACVVKDKVLDEEKTFAAMDATQAANRIRDLEAHCLAKDEEAEKTRAEVAQVQEQLQRSQSRVQEVEAEVMCMKALFDHLSGQSQIQKDVEMSDPEEVQDIEMSDPDEGEDIVMVNSDEDFIYKSQVVVLHQEQPIQKQPALFDERNHQVSWDFWHQLSASRCEELVPPTMLKWYRPLIRNSLSWGT
jgi:predicted RNase H-like nuclease (RuvC/YqgF family)